MLLKIASCYALFLLWMSLLSLTTSLYLKRRDVEDQKRDMVNDVAIASTSPVMGNGNGNGNGNVSESNVTVQLGTTAYLHCHSRVLADNALVATATGHVAWVRKRDWHILSSGMLTYTNDERFQILHADGSDDWILQIKFVQKRDNGTYECQMSSGTRVVSHLVNLQIVVPEAFIQGSGERHVDVGTSINLLCVIRKSPSPPAYVFWFHNERMINYDPARAGISVETVAGVETHSRLTIRDTQDDDSGNYTCRAPNTEQASIYVFVEEGDKMASLRKKSSGSVGPHQQTHIILSFITTYILFAVLY